MVSKELTKENLKNNYNSSKALSELMIDQLSQIDLAKAKERQEFIKFVAGFKSSSYSLNNSILLYMQAQDKQLLPVFGTFNEWKEKQNTSIQRGSNALLICMPHEYDVYLWNEEKEDETSIRRFKRVALLSKKEQAEYERKVEAGLVKKEKRTEFFYNPCIFSLSQTTMAEADRIAYLQRYNSYNTGTENEALYKKLQYISKELGLNITEKPISGEALGWVQYSNKDIVIKEDMPIDSKCAVLTHEIGHYLLHRENNSKANSERLSHSEREIQAELFSHLIMENVGIDSEKQFSLSYISTYLKGASVKDMTRSEIKELSLDSLDMLKKDTLYKNLEIVLPAVKILGSQLNNEFVSKAGIEKLKSFIPGTKQPAFVPAKKANAIME